MRTAAILFILFFVMTGYAQWESEDNNITKLTKTEQQEFLSGVKDIPQGPYTLPVDDGNYTGLPRHHDWRNYRGQNYLTPIRSQGKCGSCVVFAAVGVFEAQINITNGWPNLDLDLSEQEMLACGNGDCTGWLPGYGVEQLVNQGMISEAYFPYISGTITKNLECREFPEAKRIKAHRHRMIGHKVTTWDYNHGIFEVTPVTVREIAEALLKGPLTTSFVLWKDLLGYRSGIYRHTKGEQLGGHAVAIVGYDLDEKYWIIRNSWGPEWGEGGYFRVAMDDEDTGIANYNSQLEVLPFDKGWVAIVDHEERKVLSFRDEVQVEVNSVRAISTKVLVKKDGTVISKILAWRKNGLFSRTDKERETFVTKKNWDRLEDGIYMLQAESTYFDGGLKKALSTPVEMMIVKNDPKIKIEIEGFYQNGDRLDLAEPVVGSFYVEMNLNFQKLPPQRVELVIEHESGKKIIVKNNKPAHKTSLSWKTNQSENGKYIVHARVITGEFSSNSQSFEIIVNNQ